MLIRPCFQNVPGKNGEVSLSGYNLNPRESVPKFVQGPGGVTSGGLRVLRALCKKHYAGPLQRGINKSLQRDSNSNIHKLQYR